MAYKLDKQPGKLILRCSQPMLLIVALFLLLMIVYALIKGSDHPRAYIGVVSTIFFWLVTVLAYKDSTYVFDLINRRLVYNSFGPLLRLRKGSIDFDNIKSITLEDIPTRGGQNESRIVLCHNDCSMPLSNSFDNPQSVEECFVKIHEAVKGNTPLLARSASTLASLTMRPVNKEVAITNDIEKIVDSLIAKKKFIDAIKLVRKEANVDLKTAKDYVDQRSKQK